ncbi:glycosyltransferase, partial [Candidatus Microgenomates bacterium]|nr:glycosyltransferase [Candidatus Microgenomates bacterium]
TSEKRNVSHQRNLGADRARGKYLVFLDADCDIDPTFLEELHIEAVKRNFPFATTWIRPDSDDTGDKLMVLASNLFQELAKGINRPYAGGYNTIIKKEIFKKIKGFREDIFISEDFELALMAKKKGVEVTILKEPQVVWSLRRFRSIGTLPALRKCAKSLIWTALKGPITQKIFDYPMGGDAHKIDKKKKIDLTKLDTYLKGIEDLEKKINKLLE